MKTKYHIVISCVLLTAILVFGFTHTTGKGNKDTITWSERPLVWNDFELVRYMENDYVASIYSDFSCPNLITDKNPRVYAFMNPNFSERLRNKYDGHNVLVHEQYHFNVTEYCTRLLRKEIVEKGLGGLSYSTMESLKKKYSKKLDSLQDEYDNITNHNANSRLQRYWELKIDDLLRKTAYYSNEDIYSYYNFNEPRTNYFKHVYITFTDKILTSYPIGEYERQFGDSYEVVQNPIESIVKFYKNGELSSGGLFNTAIVKIKKKDKNTVEIHYLNADESFNDTLYYQIEQNIIDDGGNYTSRYYDAEHNRVHFRNVFETKWKYNKKEKSYYSTYLDRNGKLLKNQDSVFHEKRVLDKKDRTQVIANYNKNHKLINDTDFIARYEYDFNENHQKSFNRMYDETGSFAFHLNDYNLKYDYDERGNISRITSLDSNNKNTYDDNGASIYEYTYDAYDRETSERRFDKNHKPIIASDDYFMEVNDYDLEGRIVFKAQYYPGYVLKYSDSKWGATKYLYLGDSVISEHNTDAYNNNIDNSNGVARIKKNLDSAGQVIKESYFNKRRYFSKTATGITSYGYAYDSNSNKILSIAYDSMNKPTSYDTEVAVTKWEYDDLGNKIKESYFSSQDKPASNSEEVQSIHFKYDTRNNLIEETNYGLGEMPVAVNGVHQTRYVKNKYDRDAIKQEFDVDLKLKKGFSTTKYTYNRFGILVMERYYNHLNQPTKNEESIYGQKYDYNDRQWTIAYRNLDAFGRPFNNSDGVAMEQWTLNEIGNTEAYSYFDKNNKPVIGPEGYHRIEYKWADLAEVTEYSTYDDKGNLLNDEEGIASYKYTLAPSGLILTIKRYNQDNQLTEDERGIAESFYKESLNGLYFLEKELNAEGNSIEDPETSDK